MRRMKSLVKQWGGLLLGICILGLIPVGAQGQRLSIPAAATRRILTGDRLRISVEEQPELNRVYAVAGDGTIDFPMIGRVRIANLTTSGAADFMEKELEKKYFKNATVQVEIAEFVEGAILVMGAVNGPGSLPFKGGGDPDADGGDHNVRGLGIGCGRDLGAYSALEAGGRDGAPGADG